MAEGPLPKLHSQQTEYQFQLDVDIRKKRQRPLFQGFGKSFMKLNGSIEMVHLLFFSKLMEQKPIEKHHSMFNLVVILILFEHLVLFKVILVQLCFYKNVLHMAISLNYYEKMDLNQHETVLWKIFEQICDAMICLADNGIVHGDLACRNVLVFQSDSTEPKKNLVKLTDFGLTRESTLYSIVDSSAHVNNDNHSYAICCSRNSSKSK